MKKQSMKGSRGITLVALIITIIILLILAVVAIGAVNNTSIIQYAQNSADEYKDGRDKENATLGNYVDILNHYKPEGDKTNPPDTDPDPEPDSEPVSIVGIYGCDDETLEEYEYYIFNEDGTGEIRL